MSSRLRGSLVTRVLAVGASLVAAAAAAGAPRTFVASWGNDASLCTVAQPCRTFQTAIGVADSGGEVVALDSGSYGAFVVGRSVSVIAPDGVHAGVSADGGYGVYVNIAATDRVLLRGLAINSASTNSTNGIIFLSPGLLDIERCTINGTTDGRGIYVPAVVAPTAQRRLAIVETTVRGFDLGLVVGPRPAVPTNLALDIRDSSFVGSSFISLDLSNMDHNAEISIQRSVVAASIIGLDLQQNSIDTDGQTDAVIDDTMFTFNENYGVLIQGFRPGHPRVTLTGNVIAGNYTGLHVGAPTGDGEALGFTLQDNTVTRNVNNYLQDLVATSPL